MFSLSYYQHEQGDGLYYIYMAIVRAARKRREKENENEIGRDSLADTYPISKLYASTGKVLIIVVSE